MCVCVCVCVCVCCTHTSVCLWEKKNLLYPYLRFLLPLRTYASQPTSKKLARDENGPLHIPAWWGDNRSMFHGRERIVSGREWLEKERGRTRCRITSSKCHLGAWRLEKVKELWALLQEGERNSGYALTLPHCSKISHSLSLSPSLSLS